MSKIGIAVFGAEGLMGQRRREALHAIPGVEVAALVDVPAVAEQLARSAPAGTAWFTNPDAALRHPGIGAVVISAPTSAHFPLARAALLAGKHVLVEKPMSSRADEAEELVRLARQSGLVLMAAHNRSYWPMSRAMLALAPHVAGTPTHASAEIGHGQHTRTPRDARTERFLTEPGAGPLHDLGPHVLDMLLRLGCRFDRVVGAATTESPLLPPGVPAIEEATFAAANGATCHLNASYVRPSPFMGLTLSLGGPRGSLVLDMGWDPLTPAYTLTCATFAENPFDLDAAADLLQSESIGWSSTTRSAATGRGGQYFRFVFAYEKQDSWTGDCRAFIDAIRSGRPVYGEDGLTVMRLVEEARRAARPDRMCSTGCPERL